MEQLKKVDALKDQFLANTSHELRTPLNGIIGLSESLVDRVESNDQKEDLSMIVSSGKRLASLVNDLLDFSKLKNFDIALQLKPIDLHSLVSVVLRINQPLVKGKSIQLINVIPKDLPAIYSDENRLQQIFHNLVGNAVKFTESGYVKIGVREDMPNFQNLAYLKTIENHQLQTIFVQDTGIGIPSNKKDLIFQEFQQADGSISREFAGTGLGLSISKKLVELHGGKMWLESEVGKGSIFYFTLPKSAEKAVPITKKESSISIVSLTEEAATEKEGNPIPVAATPIGDQIHILVVDDEPINQQVLKNHLSAQHYRLTKAMNGKEAMEALESGQHFDLVLLDVMMPQMSGYEVCQQIREKFLPSELPVIMVTAKNQVQDLVQGLNLGANDYLAKPFTKAEFLARIKTHLNLNRINTATHKFVPREFLRSLGREHITDVVLGDHSEQEVTVFFSDIRDYTALSESMTPEENFQFVSAYNSRMSPVVHQNGGFVNQYLGDAIMAVFPKQPADALQAAIKMQKLIQKYNKQRISDGKKALRVGMGMHSGSLIMGIIGDEKRMDAATISDTVNVASRIESLTKHFGVSILLSEESLVKIRQFASLPVDSLPIQEPNATRPKTAELPTIELPTDFHFRYLGKVLVKGKQQPIGIYECFDGDSLEQIDKKEQTFSVFEQGLNLYFKKSFPEAILAFKKVLEINPNDAPARLFLNKAAYYISNEVAENWTGVEKMVQK